MLNTRRCPFTGIVNFYADDEPHMAVGSIARCGTEATTPSFAWRCYTGDHASSGHAPDLQTAERRLTNFIAMVSSHRSSRATG